MSFEIIKKTIRIRIEKNKLIEILKSDPEIRKAFENKKKVTFDYENENDNALIIEINF